MTGATSFLGRNLVKTFIKKGYEVFALVRKNSASIHLLPEEKISFDVWFIREFDMY
jgi:nucleoside-diphosphate-sugar epimerase